MIMESVIYVEETASTNRYMQALADAGDLPDESVVVAGAQTAGRGQAGNAWESEAGKNLTCSFLFRPDGLPAGQSFVIAELAALSVKRILDGIVPGITVKWPNDVYWLDRKICGILIENGILGGRIVRSIIGIGLNLNQTVFLSDAPNPVSLAQITGIASDPPEILEQLRTVFHSLTRQLKSEGPENIHRDYVRALYRREGFYPYRDADGCFDARIHRIEPSGHLILERKDGALSRYAFKEVSRLP
ncbi:MAG: biotin--[acetyl-CoA-carboxylase] ligase [Tannerella sp.]|jgi:BirA family biotin operon repressor/biotin-[acetyl-CoA-carboxylase] ligase|nr:biotin--[acetyl-CoA-carboxylase] ligase [Tannerella sp.]